MEVSILSLFWNLIIVIFITGSLYLWYVQQKSMSEKIRIVELKYANQYQQQQFKNQKLPLDIQFDKENYPTIVYNKLFTDPNPWYGGYNVPGDQAYQRTHQNIPETNFSH